MKKSKENLLQWTKLNKEVRKVFTPKPSQSYPMVYDKSLIDKFLIGCPAL